MKLDPTHKLFPSWMRKAPQPNATKLFAVFTDGTEREVLTLKSPTSGRAKGYQCVRPDGVTERNTMLRDLQYFLGQDFPGVRFERRHP
jgi:hypothetical protein